MSKKSSILVLITCITFVILGAIFLLKNWKTPTEKNVNTSNSSTTHYSDESISFTYVQGFKTGTETTNLPVNNLKCIYVSKIVETNPTEPSQVSVCLYSKEKSQNVESFIQSQFQRSVTLLPAMIVTNDFSGYEKNTVTKGGNTYAQFTDKQTSEKTAFRDFGTKIVSVSTQANGNELDDLYNSILNSLQIK
jgi:hypothetical protein